MKYRILIFIMVLSSPMAVAQKAQDSLYLKMNLRFASEELRTNKIYLSENKDSITLTAFKFYISGIKVHFADKSTFSQQNSFHLIDIENPQSQDISLCKNEIKKIEKISFNIGIDSTTSTSGAMEGDLDPVNAMYWAWQSGYINMKIEGLSPSCPTRKNAFQFHIGGYLPPYYALRKIELYPKENNLSVNADLSKIFRNLELSMQNSIMIPGKEAMKIADNFAGIFTVE